MIAGPRCADAKCTAPGVAERLRQWSDGKLGFADEPTRRARTLGHGNDTTADFADGDDLLDPRPLGIASFDDVVATTVGNDILIDLGAADGGSILIKGRALGELHASDFLR